jgi:DNA-binding beta-propeller fold protein YncE
MGEDMRTGIALRAVVALALLAGGLTACFDGGSSGDDSANAPTGQPGVLRTLSAWAGSPDPGGWGNTDGTGSEARFGRPGYLVVAADDSVWIGDGNIRRMDAEGHVTTVLNLDVNAALDIDAGSRRLSLGYPGAMAAAPSGGAFVAMERVGKSPGGFPMRDGSWAVLHIAPGATPRLVALPPAEEAVTLSASALAIDSQGRLYIATECAIWRSDAQVPDSTAPRGVKKLYDSGPAASPGSGCIPYSGHGITRLAVDANDRVLFTLRHGDVKRLEADAGVTTLGQTSTGEGCSMAVDPRGGILLTGASPVLLRMDHTGQETTVAGMQDQPGSVDGDVQSARFDSLCGVAIDRQGRIVLADSGNHTIRRIEVDGTVVTVAGRPPQEGYADGVGQDALFSRDFTIGPGMGGKVLVADTENTALREVDAGRRVSTLAGGPRIRSYPPPAPDGPIASTYFDYIGSPLRAGDGSVWIADGDRVRRWGTDGIIRTMPTSGYEAPRALALDPNGDVIVARNRDGEFWYPSLVDGYYLERYSTRNPQAAPERLLISLPDEVKKHAGGSPLTGLCALPDGSFVFTLAFAVLHRGTDGTTALLAGSPHEPGNRDGPGTAARFYFPMGLACDASGGIYVADMGNHTVRYIDAQRNVRTVLGTPGRAGHRVDAVPGELDRPRSLVLVPGGLIVATGQGLVRAGF